MLGLENVLQGLDLFFFFQAEDGIRYRTVTGVQTCALPISRRARPAVRPNRPREGVIAARGHAGSRRPQRPRPGRHPAGAVLSSPILGRGLRGVRLRLARRRAQAGRGRAGARLPRRDGGDRCERDPCGGRQPACRCAGGMGRSPDPSFEPGAVTRLLRDRRAVLGAGVLSVVVAIALAAPFVTSGDVATQHDIVATRFLPPLATDARGTVHPLGTDRFGRDVWTRLAYGARISLGVGTLAVLLSIAIGLAVGAVAGYARRPVRTLLLALTDVALALPRVVLLLLLATLWRPSAALVILVLGVTGWMSVARLVQGEVRSLAARPFVEGASALGMSRGRVLWRHIIPNALTPVIVAAALGLGNAIMLEAGLSFLGLGVQPPTPSWGNMIASGRDTLVNAPWVAAAPGVALAVVVVACTLLGDALQDALDPARVYP